jgi:hypothetical protein
MLDRNAMDTSDEMKEENSDALVESTKKRPQISIKILRY